MLDKLMEEVILNLSYNPTFLLLAISSGVKVTTNLIPKACCSWRSLIQGLTLSVPPRPSNKNSLMEEVHTFTGNSVMANVTSSNCSILPKCLYLSCDIFCI
ncbi:hypothetical protein WICPIJ_007137 [Wickerhamomyces pijperi]|uniref:Uncharacterized protein n=1 Tax=Wickerhamomyces pijperi TaxID=599730 RepID=A0A9P8TKC5_WICPI|nr:hypothetical protein WICPIJ_007137 [Wickerhamomyces pijperi]